MATFSLRYRSSPRENNAEDLTKLQTTSLYYINTKSILIVPLNFNRVKKTIVEIWDLLIYFLHSTSIGLTQKYMAVVNIKYSKQPLC